MCHPLDAPFPRKRDPDEMSSDDADADIEQMDLTPRKRACLHSGGLCWRRGLAWRAVVLDLDETTGSWGLASLAYKMFIRFAGYQPPTNLFVKHYLELGGARPFLREFLRTLQRWKQANRIDEVAIFTSASNAQGWVSYLQRCMEEYAGTADLFGRCIAREDAPLAPSTNGTRTIKDLSMISTDRASVVLVDDKPEYALNGYVIGVPEYTQDVVIESLAGEMKKTLPDYVDDIDAVFAADRTQYPLNNVDFSGDEALVNSIQVLSDIFPDPDKDSSSVQNQSGTSPTVLTDCRSEYSLAEDAAARDSWGHANQPPPAGGILAANNPPPANPNLVPVC